MSEDSKIGLSSNLIGYVLCECFESIHYVCKMDKRELVEAKNGIYKKWENRVQENRGESPEVWNSDKVMAACGCNRLPEGNLGRFLKVLLELSTLCSLDGDALRIGLIQIGDN